MDIRERSKQLMKEDKSMENIKKNKSQKNAETWGQKTAEQQLQTFVSMMDKALLSYPSLIKRSLVAGVFTGLGATIGVTLIFAIIAALIHWLGFVPILGDFINQTKFGEQVTNLTTKK